MTTASSKTDFTIVKQSIARNDSGRLIETVTSYTLHLGYKERLEQVACVVIEGKFEKVSAVLKEELIAAVHGLESLVAGVGPSWLPTGATSSLRALTPLVPKIKDLEQDAAHEDTRKILHKELQRLKSLREAPPWAAYGRELKNALGRLIVALDGVTEPSRHERLKKNSFAAKSLNRAKGEVTKLYNARVKKLLADPQFVPGELHLHRLHAAEAEALVLARDFFFAGAKSWRTRVEPETRLPRAERAV